jgi:putative flavoprotein involved in K+ transport
VICATGYARGLEPIAGHLGVLRPDGLPTHFNAAPEHPDTPRLYFAGFYGAPAGQIRILPTHARRIARAAARDRALAAPQTRASSETLAGGSRL